jgi:2-iminobutanoate/2-iminopropanoate deaminase
MKISLLLAFALLTAGASAQTGASMTIERKNYPSLPSPAGPYVHAVKANGVLFLSGITAFGLPAQKGSISEQLDAVYGQIEQIAKHEGANLSRIVKVTIYVTEFEDLAGLRKVLFQRYGEALPASSLVRVAGLFSPDLKVEVEAVLAL